MPQKVICPHCGKQFELADVTASEMGKRSVVKMKRTKEDFAAMGRKSAKKRKLSPSELSALGKLGAQKRWGRKRAKDKAQ